MNSFNRKCISIVLMTSVMSCCVQVFGAAIQENEDTLADAVLLTRAKYVRHVRHVPVLRHGNKISEPITLPSMKDSADWEEDLLRNNDTNNSAEINFSEEEDDRKGPWTRMLASTIAQSAQVRNHSTVVSSQLETNSSYLNMQIAAASDSSETPSQSKAQRGIPVENAEARAVFIDEEKDKAFDENESEGSSKLWIYSNAICILLVVGVSIFLIYYPKKDRRKTCKQDSSESSSSTSSASSTA